MKDGAVKKYYSIAGMMVATQDASGLQYLLTDHLGSTVAVTNSSGTLTSQQRYLPFGAIRTIPNSPILGTDFGYTGQRMLDAGMGGIMDYKARFYSPYINQFIQPDTIIPNPANPQSWNRFSYVYNNPIKYSDPTGHCADPATGTICLGLVPTGPVGWAVIGLLLIVDVVLIGVVIERWQQDNSHQKQKDSIAASSGQTADNNLMPGHGYTPPNNCNIPCKGFITGLAAYLATKFVNMFLCSADEEICTYHPTPQPSPDQTPTATLAPTSTPTPTLTLTPTSTATSTPSPTLTMPPTNTSTQTPTSTSIPSYSPLPRYRRGLLDME